MRKSRIGQGAQSVGYFSRVAQAIASSPKGCLTLFDSTRNVYVDEHLQRGIVSHTRHSNVRMVEKSTSQSLCSCRIRKDRRGGIVGSKRH